MMSNLMVEGYKVNITSSTGAGNSSWGTAYKDGKKYFVKMLKEKYVSIPYSEANSFQRDLIEESKIFEERINRLYKQLEVSNMGNLILPISGKLFKKSGCYYVITEWVDQFASFKEINKFTVYQKNLMMMVLAYSLYGLSEGNIVHSDLKPDNIRIKNTVSGAKTLKIIDFENSFIEGDYPVVVGGDQNYMSPELRIRQGQDEDEEAVKNKIQITPKSDIFSLGIIFHEILTGKLPLIQDPKIKYACVAKLKRKNVVLHSEIPKKYSELINLMIDLNPNNRPCAYDIFKYLKENIDPLSLE